MASHPIPQATSDAPEQPLTREEGWQLFQTLRGVLKESYVRLGGAEEFHRHEREAWNEDTSRG